MRKRGNPFPCQRAQPFGFPSAASPFLPLSLPLFFHSHDSASSLVKKKVEGAVTMEAADPECSPDNMFFRVDFVVM